MWGELPEQAVLHSLRPTLMPLWTAVQQQVSSLIRGFRETEPNAGSFLFSLLL